MAFSKQRAAYRLHPKSIGNSMAQWDISHRGLGDGASAAEDVALSFSFERLPPGFYDDPYPVYAALQAHAPVHRLAPGKILLTRYADVERVYKDHETFSSDKRVEFGAKYGPTPLYDHHTTSLVFNDPPLHTRVRRLIAGAFTPRAIATMEAGIIALVDRLLDEVAARGTVDLIEHFAGAIPVEVIGNLLAVPREEREPLRRWSLAILGALEPFPSTDVLAAGNRAVVDFTDYLEGLVVQRRRRPGDPSTDILTRLIQGEEPSERLSETELLQNCIFILNAGHETTTNLIGNGLQLLVEWPGERERLIRNPELIKTAVEEMLRFESSNQLGNRIATADFELGGENFPAGTQITLGIGAANRDPAQFASPQVFDITRQPNRHLAFATGIHQCAGMNVARLEGRIAMARFLARFPAYAPAAPPTRSRRVRFRGFTALPVRLA